MNRAESLEYFREFRHGPCVRCGKDVNEHFLGNGELFCTPTGKKTILFRWDFLHRGKAHKR